MGSKHSVHDTNIQNEPDDSAPISINTIDLPPTTPQMSYIDTGSTNSLNSQASNYSFTPSKKLLYTLDPSNLALIVKYIVENEALFEKYKHESDNIYHAFINFRIKGKMIRKLTSMQFADELPWIRRVISTRIHIWLKTISDEEILSILNKMNGSLFIPSTRSTSRSSFHFQDGSASGASLEYDDYDICINNEDPLVFEQFVSILCTRNMYTQSQTNKIVNVIHDIAINGKQFMDMKRTDFCRLLKANGIKAGNALKLHKLILSNSENVAQYVHNNNECVVVHYEERIKLNAVDIAEIAVKDFNITAHKLLDRINEKMTENSMNGMELTKYYESKRCLQMYLMENIKHKTVSKLVDVLWLHYERRREREIARVERYDKENLFKYFISLFMHKVKSMVIKHDLSEDKLMTLKRKELCTIFVDECGFSVGVVTNIVDNIYQSIGNI